MLKVVYVTAEMFTNEFIQAISDKKTNSFKNKYRKVDVLLIDDIHFLQGKDSTQEELFHTFNNLYDTNKQLVFTCDRPISELKDLTARLRSRFERGLNVDLQPPNYETRMAILRLKCEEKNSYMSDDVLDYISRNINTNVRDLEASLTKLIAYSDLLGQEITLDIAKEQLKTSYPIINANQALSIDTIIKVVAEYFNISPYDIRGKKRTKSLVQPRQIAMYIARHITDFSTTEIGNDFGGRDHTTVMHAIQRIEGLIKSDSGMSNTIQKLEREIQNYKKN
jgi:chromosomal replication initiator protein